MNDHTVNRFLVEFTELVRKQGNPMVSLMPSVLLEPRVRQAVLRRLTNELTICLSLKRKLQEGHSGSLAFRASAGMGIVAQQRP